MGYLSRGQCFATKEEASDFQLSHVAPTITADGALKTPVYQNGHWYYGQQQIQLTFPECDQTAQFKDGVQVGAQLAALLFIAWAFRVALRLFSKGITDDSKEVY